MDLKGLIAKL